MSSIDLCYIMQTSKKDIGKMANAYERHDISDESWAKIEFLLPGRKGTWGGNARDNRQFLKSNFCYRGVRELGAATLATTGNLSM